MTMLLIYSILIAIFAVVFSYILIEEGMILDWWGRILKKLPEKVADPLGQCAYCLSGQIALWFYILQDGYSLIEHVFFVSMTIFITHLILYIYEQAQ